MKKPKSWKEVTINQWKEIRSIEADEFPNVVDYQIERLSILMELSNSDPFFDELTTKELRDLNQEFYWINTEPSKVVRADIKNFKYKGTKSMTLAEYIDLDGWCVKGFVENFERICAIKFRDSREGDWGEPEQEPYWVYDKAERAKLFEGASIDDYYGVIVDFLTFRDRFMGKYSELFEGSDLEEQDEDDEPIIGLDRIEKIKAERQAKALKSYSWERFIFQMADGDITKYRDIVRLPLLLVFNTLAMRKEFNL